MAGMRERFLLLLIGLGLPFLALGAVADGCSSTVVVPSPPGQGGSGGAGGAGGAGEGGCVFDAGADVLEEYIDPGCPDAGPKMTDFTCNAYDQDSGDCPMGQGCYIFVQYPMTVCGQEVYGTACEPAGMGAQGASCGGGQDCAPGLACVVSGAGDQCVTLCPLTGDDGCPDGLVCEPIDVEGFGGCL
jgi:hypothetical protein